jgi:hypothetical protein
MCQQTVGGKDKAGSAHQAHVGSFPKIDRALHLGNVFLRKEVQLTSSVRAIFKGADLSRKQHSNYS